MEENPTRRLLIIDDDVSIGASAQANGSYFLGGLKTGFNEIDGGLEIVYALNSPGVELVGVTTVFGNTWVEYADESAREILDRAGRPDIPVHRGAAGPEELGHSTDASRFIVRTARANPGDLTLVASGPLTNIAKALIEEPDLPWLVESFHYFGGILEPETFPGMIDFNTAGDPDAADLVLGWGRGVNLYPESITMGAPFKFEDLDALRTVETDMARYLVPKIEPWILAQSLVFGIRGFYPFDMSALAVLIEPELAERVEYLRLKVVADGAPLGNLKKGATRLVEAPDRPLVQVWQGIRPVEARKRYRERLR